MPRPKRNPFEEGTVEYAERAAILEQEKADKVSGNGHTPTERNITVTVSIEAINAAKALGVLSGITYRRVLGAAAQAGVDALVTQVQSRLRPQDEHEEGPMPF